MLMKILLLVEDVGVVIAAVIIPEISAPLLQVCVGGICVSGRSWSK